MKVFSLFLTFVILTAARPDGYSYSEPDTAQQFLPSLSVPSTPINQFSGSSFNTFAEPVQPQIHKNIYIYLPPAEQQNALAEQNFATPTTPQLHYKIIFIKAPTYEQQLRQQAAAAVANQEKTLVYVLVKRPDDIVDQPTPTPAEYTPDKPEVYFIKYKTKAVAQSQLQSQFNVPAPTYGAPSNNQDPRSSASLAYSAPPANIVLPYENPPQAF